jgi:hypothetical protein
MIYWFLGVVVGLSIWDISKLKQEGLSREIFCYLVCMVVVVIVGISYLSDTFRPSLAEHILAIIKVKG